MMVLNCSYTVSQAGGLSKSGFDQKMRDLIQQFVLACEDRQFRVKAIYHIIRGMR